MNVKELLFFVVLFFGFSGKFEIKWWEIVVEVMFVSEDEIYIYILFFLEVNIDVMERKLFDSFLRYNRLFFNVVVNNSFIIVEFINLFSEVDFVIMLFWIESFELVVFGVLFVGLLMLVRGFLGFGKVLKEVFLGF